jgi:hypothetical protein
MTWRAMSARPYPYSEPHGPPQGVTNIVVATGSPQSQGRGPSGEMAGVSGLPVHVHREPGAYTCPLFSST